MNDALTVFDIQRFCLHDGPGIRSVVFLKGCPLRCRWCQNPESLAPGPELAFYADRCRGCMACLAACEHGAILPGPLRVDRSRCRACGSCAARCPHEALRLVGERVPVDRLTREVLADRAYFAATGGGVTLSGGEPLAQAAGAAALLARCRREGVHTTLETSGAASWAAFEQVLPHVDLFYFDLKAGAGDPLRRWTGGQLASISDRARRLVQSGAEVAFRMPVVPGFNDTEEHARGIASLLLELGHDAIRLLPYHRGGEAKIPRLESDQPLLGLTGDSLAAVTDRFEAHGITAVVDGERGAAPAPAIPARVERLRRAVQSSPPAICSERADLVTQYFRDRRNRDKPLVIQKAEALAQLLVRRRIAIHEDELLVGNFSSKRVGGSLFPELHGVAMLEDLLAFDTREVNPLRLDPDERRILLSRVMPFWAPRFLSLRAFSLPRALRFVYEQLRGEAYLINETAGISHFVPDYAALLELGTDGIARRALRRARAGASAEQRHFLRGVAIVCEGLARMSERFAARAWELGREEIARACSRVPRHPARTLHEAFQALLMAQIALNLESLDNSVSPGRLDQLLNPFYLADLEAGRIDEHGARELVGCFTVKLSEIVPVFSRRITRFHGGMFNGQVVVVGGTDAAGEDATNPMTWLFLEAMDRLRMRQPNYHVRLHPKSPPALVERVAAMLRDGSGAPSVMNDAVVVPMLVRRGATEREARDYSPVGCVEPVVCNATFGSTDAALVNLPLCLQRALTGELCSTEQVFRRYEAEVRRLVARLMEELQAIERANARWHPTPLTSALLRGCLESATDASSGGAIHNGSGVQGVGVADVADSLAAVEEVVFRRGECGISSLLEALRADFAGHEHLRVRLLHAPKFGNDDPRVDRYAERVMRGFADALSAYTNTRGGRYWAGFYSVTAHLAFGERVGALPSGRRAGQPLANGLSPATGLERLGPTAALNSVAGLPAGRVAENGVNVNLKLDPTCLTAAALAGLLRGYCDSGGMQVQVNALDPEVLLEARDHPERHPNLLVRVSGYSAYFNDLSPEVKQEIIERNLHRGRG